MRDEKKRGSLVFLAGFGVGMLCMAVILGTAFWLFKLRSADSKEEIAGRTAVQEVLGTVSSEPAAGGQELTGEGQETWEGQQELTGERQDSVTGQQEPTGEQQASAAGQQKPSEEQKGDDRAASAEYTAWNAESTYTGGDEVLFDGGIFRARWWTQGEEPVRQGDSVWEYLGDLPAESAAGGLEESQGASRQYETSVTVKREISEGDFRVVAYYPSWKEGQDNLDKLRFDIVTHVNYAFAIPTADGGLRPLENPELAKAVIEKAHNSGAKALIAVGGWSYNDTPLENTFVEATSSDEKIEKFGNAILKLCNDYGFDGVDMDWEHPRVDGSSAAQYEKLMIYLADKLHQEGKLLTSAVLSGVTADGLVYYDAPAHSDNVLDAVDWINVMAYDGGDGERHSTYEFAVNCGNYWKETRGLDASKVVLGLPFYGRPSWASYGDLLSADAAAAESDVTLYNGMEAWYNGPETIGKKTEYALQSLGGVMIWEITQDTPDREYSLLTAVGKTITSSQP